MRVPSSPVNTEIQPSLFPVPAVRVLLEILIDHQEDEAVISIFAQDPGQERLLAFSSRRVSSLDRVADAIREVGPEFTALIHEHTGPFAP